MSVELRQKPISKGRKSLYLDIYESGSRRYEFLKLYLLPTSSTENRLCNKDTIKLAEAIRAKREISIKNEEYGFSPNFKKKANFIEYLAAYRDSMTVKSTWSGYHNVYLHLRAFAGDVLPFSGITPHFIENFKKYLLNASSLSYKRSRKPFKGEAKKLSPNTARKYFNSLYTAYLRAIKEKIVSQDPFKEVQKIPPTESTREFLDLSEIEALFKAECKQVNIKRAFLFACFTGLRLSDLRNLSWANVQNERIEIIQKKTNRKVIIPLAETAKQLLPPPESADKKIFTGLTNKKVEIGLNNLCKKAGVTKRVTFHVARHTFATLSLTQGADLYTVSKLLGHANIHTTQIYAKVIDEKKHQAIQLLPTIEIPKSLTSNSKGV